MDKSEQIQNIITKLKNNKPAKAFKKFSNDLDSGMRFVLMYLIDKKKAYASLIGEEMQISRARVGILLKKMETRGLIIKSAHEHDSRIEIIELTSEGLIKCNEIKLEMIRYISNIIDRVGYDKLNKFLDTACEIKAVLEEGGYID